MTPLRRTLAVSLPVILAAGLAAGPTAAAASTASTADARPVASVLVPAGWNGSDPTHVFAFSNYRSRTATARETYAASVRNCPKRIVKIAAIPLRTARARITAWLRSTSALRVAVTRFYASRESRTVAGARGAAGLALLSRHPFAAMVATVRWADLAPRDPLALVSAATMLTRVGRLAEAQAYLTAAAALKPSTTRGPLGIDAYSQWLNARGYLLLTAGQYAAARTVLTLAVARQPLLAEARTNLSAVTMCQKRVPVLNAGRTRVKPRTGTALPADPMDTSSGVPMGLPMAPIPESPVGFPVAPLTAKAEAVAATAETLRVAYEQAGFDAARVPVSTATYQRREYLESRILGPEAHYGELFWGVENEMAALQRFWTEYNAAPAPPDVSETCTGDDQKQLAWYPRWRSLQLAYVQAVAARDDARYRFVTGVLANATPLWARPYVLGEQYRAWVWQATMVYWGAAGLNATPWYVEPGHCGTPTPADAVEAPAAPGTPSFCSAPSAIKLVVDIVVAKVKLSCDLLSLEARTPGWVSAFARFDYNVGAGTVTVFAGVRAGGSYGALSADAKAGFYASADSTGMTDVGVRAEAKAAAGWNGAEVTVASTSGSESLAGALEMGP